MSVFYEKNIDFFIEKIKNNDHFKYSRFNDGEFISIINKTPNKGNCDGHQYFPQMGNELKDVLLNYKKSDHYYLELFDHWYNLLPHIKEIVDSLHKQNNDIRFLKDDFIRMSHEKEPDKFNGFMELIFTKNVTIVGPNYLNELKKFFDFDFIEIPLKNCYLDKDRIINEIIANNQKLENNYYLFSASMPTKIIIDKFKDDVKNTYLDWGSVWDTFFVSNKYNFIRKRSSSNLPKYMEIYKKYLI